MRVLVTGATGFIGSHVVPELLARRHEVRVLARESSDSAGLPQGIEIVRGELEDSRAAAGGMDALVHLAGIGGGLLRRSDRQGSELRRVNVEGTRKVFEAAHGAGVRRAVLVTSMWTVLRPDLAASSPYLASRLDSERAAIEAAGGRPETVILCPTFVVGAGDRGPNFPGSLVLACLKGRMKLAPSGGTTWVAARDVARTVVAALTRGEDGSRYLVGAEHLAHLDMFTRVARLGGVRPPVFAVPKAWLRAGAAAGDLALAAFFRHAPIPLRLGLDLLCTDTPADCRPAWKDLAEPTEKLDQAIREAIDWFRRNGYASPPP